MVDLCESFIHRLCYGGKTRLRENIIGSLPTAPGHPKEGHGSLIWPNKWRHGRINCFKIHIREILGTGFHGRDGSVTVVHCVFPSCFGCADEAENRSEEHTSELQSL